MGSPLVYFGHQGLLVPMLDRTGGGGGGGGGNTPHTPPPTYPHRPPTPPPPPSHGRLPSRRVGPTGRRGKAGGAAPGHGPCGPRSLRFLSPRLHSGLASLGSGWGQHCSALPFRLLPNRKGRKNFPLVPPIHMRGGSGWEPPPHLGLIRPREREDRGDNHPESGPD